MLLTHHVLLCLATVWNLSQPPIHSVGFKLVASFSEKLYLIVFCDLSLSSEFSILIQVALFIN